MRPEENSLDLNNLPVEEFGKQLVEESSTTTAASADHATRSKKKKNARDESPKVYECRFCSLKFCKSQALGGHMNRHRQERETETLNRARQLVFSNEALAGTTTHMGYRDVNVGGSQAPVLPGGFHQLRPAAIYPRLQTQPIPPQLAQVQYNMYPSPSPSSYTTSCPPAYAPRHSQNSIGDYFIGHVLSDNPASQLNLPHQPNYGSTNSNFTCFGAPLTNAFQQGVQAPIVRESHVGPNNQTHDARNWTATNEHGRNA